MFWSSDIINEISNKLKNEKGEDKLENYCLKENTSVILIDTPKPNSSVRDILINKKLYEILKKIKGRHKGEDYVLTGSNIKYVEQRNYQHSFKMILKKRKIW